MPKLLTMKKLLTLTLFFLPLSLFAQYQVILNSGDTTEVSKATLEGDYYTLEKLDGRTSKVPKDLVRTVIRDYATGFKWDVIIDSLDNSKSELYSKTKLFIGQTWKSAQNVIQSDDAESGVILVKGLSIQDVFYQMNNHRWTYAYSVTFMIKDNKCRIIVDNVYCDAARTGSYEWPRMPVADTYPDSKGLITTGVNEARYLELMSTLKAELQSMVNSYSNHVRKPLIEENSDW